MRHMHKILLSELQRTLFKQQRTEEDSEPDEAEQFERQLHIDEMNRYERQLQNAIRKKEELRSLPPPQTNEIRRIVCRHGACKRQLRPRAQRSCINPLKPNKQSIHVVLP